MVRRQADLFSCPTGRTDHGAWTYGSVKLDGGFYTVEVTNTANNCKAAETFHINDDPYVISIPAANLTLTDQTDCAPVNGSALVTDVLVDGVSSGGAAGFNFTWLQDDGTTTIPGSGNAAAEGAPLAAGNYFVQTTNIVSNCTSPQVQFIINDKTVTPSITGTVVDNTNCAGCYTEWYNYYYYRRRRCADRLHHCLV